MSNIFILKEMLKKMLYGMGFGFGMGLSYNLPNVFIPPSKIIDKKVDTIDNKRDHT